MVARAAGAGEDEDTSSAAPTRPRRQAPPAHARYPIRILFSEVFVEYFQIIGCRFVSLNVCFRLGKTSFDEIGRASCRERVYVLV